MAWPTLRDDMHRAHADSEHTCMATHAVAAESDVHTTPHHSPHHSALDATTAFKRTGRTTCEITSRPRTRPRRGERGSGSPTEQERSGTKRRRTPEQHTRDHRWQYRLTIPPRAPRTPGHPPPATGCPRCRTSKSSRLTALGQAMSLPVYGKKGCGPSPEASRHLLCLMPYHCLALASLP